MSLDDKVSELRKRSEEEYYEQGGRNMEYTFLEIYNMSPKERKRNRVSLELRIDDVGNNIATWCQVVKGALIIKQAVADLERKHFINGIGMASVINIKDLALITGLLAP